MLVWCLPTKQTPSAATTNNQTQHMQPKKNLLLKIVLALTATFIVLSGLNIGLGGIPTLGWGGQKDFLTVTNETDYRIQDSHVRYVGGLWLGIGLFFFLSLTNLAKVQNHSSFLLCADIFWRHFAPVSGTAGYHFPPAGASFPAG
jgi:hypothetical protein